MNDVKRVLEIEKSLLFIFLVEIMISAILLIIMVTKKTDEVVEHKSNNYCYEIIMTQVVFGEVAVND